MLENLSKNFKSNGLSNNKILISNNKVFKYVKLNNKTQNILNWLQTNNNQYLPNLTITQDWVCYDVINGYTFVKIGLTNVKHLIQILITIQNLQKIKYKGKYIVHGDLSPVNVIFDENLHVKKIIDWDIVRIGSKYQDPAYVFWLWIINFGSEKKTLQQIKYQANIFKKMMNYNNNDLNKIKKWIYKVIKKEMKKHSDQLKNDKILLNWYLECIKWVKQQWNMLWN